MGYLSTNTVHLIRAGDTWLADKQIFSMTVFQYLETKKYKIEAVSNDGARVTLTPEFDTSEEAHKYIVDLMMGEV